MDNKKTFLTDGAGITPSTFVAEEESPFRELKIWITQLSLSKDDYHPFNGNVRLGKGNHSKAARALRLNINTAISNCRRVDPVWETLYETVYPYTSSPAGLLETGAVCHKGRSWVDSLFETYSMGWKSQREIAKNGHPTYALLTFVNKALDELKTPQGKKDWLNVVMTSLATQPWKDQPHGHWMLVLLDIWQGHGIRSNEAKGGRPETTTLALDCVKKLDALLEEFYPGQPLFWRLAAREVERRLDLVSSFSPSLPEMVGFPLNMPALNAWKEDYTNTQSSKWKTPVCSFVDMVIAETKSWSDNPGVNFLGIMRGEGVEIEKLGDNLIHLIRQANPEEMVAARQSLKRLAKHFETMGFAPNSIVSVDRILMEVLTPAVSSYQNDGIHKRRGLRL